MSASSQADELIERFAEAVDGLVSQYLDRHHGRLCTAMSATVREDRSGKYRTSQPDLSRAVSETGLVGTLSWLEFLVWNPGQAKARYAELVRSRDFASTDMTSKDRLARAEELRGRLRTLEELHEAAVVAAGRCSPPVVIGHLPAVQERRDLAAVRSRREEERAAVRDRATNAVDAQFNRPKSRVLTAHEDRAAGRSQYIESGGALGR
jgi:hypothetical protein